MQLFLEPLDVWLFRDGRPFDAGSDHRAQSIFPPYPSVIQGAVRSHQLVLQGIDLRDPDQIARAVGTADDVLGLRLRGPFLAKRREGAIVRYYPRPADAVMPVGDEPRLRRASVPELPPATLRTSSPTPCLLGLQDEPAKYDQALWLAEESLDQYLSGAEVRGEPAAALFDRERRFGIGVDSARHTTLEGALYEAEFIRPRDGVGLLVEVEGYEGWPDHGVLRLGGEAHAASYVQVQSAAWPAPPERLPAHFLLYFAAPALFDGGWQPAGGDWGRFFEGAVRLEAAAIGQYESIGGFDMSRPRSGHKPARRYLPAGSVYYFSAAGSARLRPGLMQAAVTDGGAEIGLGQVRIGSW